MFEDLAGLAGPGSRVLEIGLGPRALDPAARAGLLDCIASLIDTGYGGPITRRYLTELRVASTPVRGGRPAS